MSSRGLPGFLRRTRRGDIDESDDDVDEKVAVQRPQSNSKNNSNGALTAIYAYSPPAKGVNTESSGIDLEGERMTEAPHRNESSSTLDSSVGATNDIASPNVCLDSLNSSFASQNNLTSSKRITYRESQFNKILGAQVVKLPELRKLGWNGIPVRVCDDSESPLN